MEISVEELLALQHAASDEGYTTGYEDGLIRASQLIQNKIDELEARANAVSYEPALDEEEEYALSETKENGSFSEYQYDPNNKDADYEKYGNFGPDCDDYKEPLTR